METPLSACVQVVSDHPVERFLRKLLLSSLDVDQLIIVSPFIGSLAGTRYALSDLCTRFERSHTPICVVTREPQEPYHREGVVRWTPRCAQGDAHHSCRAPLAVCGSEATKPLFTAENAEIAEKNLKTSAFSASSAVRFGSLRQAASRQVIHSARSNPRNTPSRDSDRTLTITDCRRAPMTSEVSVTMPRTEPRPKTLLGQGRDATCRKRCSLRCRPAWRSCRQ